MELFAKIVNGFQPLTIFAKCSILDVRLGSGCAFVFQNRKIAKLWTALCFLGTEAVKYTLMLHSYKISFWTGSFESTAS